MFILSHCSSSFSFVFKEDYNNNRFFPRESFMDPNKKNL